MTYIVQRKDRFYVVAYDGLDPLTGRERRRWIPVRHDRSEAHAIASRLEGDRTSPPPTRGGPNELGVFLATTWLPQKLRQVRATTAYRYPGLSTTTSTPPWRHPSPAAPRRPSRRALRTEAGLADLVGFLVTVDDDDGDGTLEKRRWSLQLGWRSRSTLGPLVANLAACVSWGDWRPLLSDLDLPITPGTSELRAALRRGQFVARRLPALPPAYEFSTSDRCTPAIAPPPISTGTLAR
jgi:hypothetical protein